MGTPPPEIRHCVPWLKRKTATAKVSNCHDVTGLDLDLESNRKTPGRDITPMEMKGGTTEDDV